MMKWFPTVMMKQKMNLRTRGLRWNQHRIESTEKWRKDGKHSEKTVHGRSKQMIAASTNSLIL